jgi:hypothetical protein
MPMDTPLQQSFERHSYLSQMYSVGPICTVMPFVAIALLQICFDQLIQLQSHSEFGSELLDFGFKFSTL